MLTLGHPPWQHLSKQLSDMLKTPEKIRVGRASGFSLVELMISITVGLVVLGGVVGIFSSSVKSNADALKMTRLNQELQATMSMMTRDIRRAEYWRNATSAIGGDIPTPTPNTNPFTLDTPSNYSGEAANSCITFSYDMDADGNIDLGSTSTAPTNDADERFGFRLRDQAIEMRREGLACAVVNWVDIADDKSTQITTLQFTLKTQPPIDLDGPATPSPPGGCVTGCGTSTINVREVQITLEGRLKNDTSVKRTLQETVRIRSDRWSSN